MTPEQLALQERRKIISKDWLAARREEDKRHEAEVQKINSTYGQLELELQDACVAAGGHVDDGGFMFNNCKIYGKFEG